MHEYSIVSSLLARVEGEARAHQASAVHRIYLAIGEMSGVEVDLLRSAFELVRERSLCAGAELEVETVAVRWCCPACGAEIARGSTLRCPTCELPARLDGGDEIVLKRIEMEVA